MNKRDVQMGWIGYVHVAAIRMKGIVNVLQLIMSLVSVYETGFVFRSLMARGKKLLLSLSVFVFHRRETEIYVWKNMKASKS